MLIAREEIANRIPHSGAMCLLEQVVAWDANNIHCRAISHRSAENPLRGDGQLAAVCGIEYAAQAMALHGSLCGAVGQRPRAGYLASVRECRVEAARLDTLAGELDVTAERLFDDGHRVIYAFSLACEGRLVLSGRAAVVLDPDAPLA